jgi:hypothetical protein
VKLQSNELPEEQKGPYQMEVMHKDTKTEEKSSTGKDSATGAETMEFPGSK